MKKVTLEELSRDTSSLLHAAQGDRLFVTRDGKPIALIVGIENLDAEDWDLATSPEFWQMIEERRRETDSISLEELRASLEAEEKSATGPDGTARANRDAAESSGTANTQE